MRAAVMSDVETAIVNISATGLWWVLMRSWLGLGGGVGSGILKRVRPKFKKDPARAEYNHTISCIPMGFSV